MTTDAVLVLAWLILAHLAADFLLQTDGMVADKSSTAPRRQWRGLAIHGAAVALCLTPFAAAYGAPGALLLVVVAASHVLIDRWKVRATRHAEARALAGAHRRKQTDGDGDGLGPAWTPAPAGFFVLDQLLHLFVTVAAWLVLLAPAQPIPEWLAVVDRVAQRTDPTELHRWALGAAVIASLLIVNIRGGQLLVATLVRPRESVTGVPTPPSPPPAPAPAPARPTGWRLRIGPLVATAEPAPPSGPATPAPAAPTGARSPAADGHASPARIGATIGILERLLIVTFVLTGSTAAIGFVVAAKTLARFKQLDDRDFAEYYLLGTLASVAIALGSALVAQAALGTVPGG
jgi:hypothetical protein